MNTPAIPATPVPSATVMLVRERGGRVEVLMVERGAGAVFGQALVFPGGKLDAHDASDAWDGLVSGDARLEAQDRALRIAGWREVYEETGLLPGHPSVTPADCRAPFADVLRAAGLLLPLDAMLPVGRWITPRRSPKRFDTWFFLAAHDGHEALCDGFETVSAEWITPEDALELGRQGLRNLMFPTRAQLRRMAGYGSIDALMEALQDASLEPIEPRRELRGDRTFVTIPSGLGYDICEEDITDLM